MKTDPKRESSLRCPRLNSLARRLIRFHTGALLDVDDLVAEARKALWEHRDTIMGRPDPVATCYTTARRAMWRAVKKANRGSDIQCRLS